LAHERKVDYNSIAASYDARYDVEPLQGIADALIEFIRRQKATAVLEVGCGTGRWLRDVQVHASLTVGADAAIEMLRNRRSCVPVTAARANALPFRPAIFDLVYCVNALHHFDDRHRFVSQAAELLKPGGSLAFIGIDPRLIRTRYFYDYFASTLERDMRRYPSIGTMVDWMAAAGFTQIEYRIAQTWTSRFTGRSVLEDKLLRKESNSTLALLTDEEYQEGIRKLEASIAQAESERREITFETVMPFGMLTASRPL
jgi:SAM-dependent methyltransferase